jgi:hypothetical protein
MKKKLVGALMTAEMARKAGDQAGYDKAMAEAQVQKDRIVQDSIDHGASPENAEKRAGQMYAAMNPSRIANGGALPTEADYETRKSFLSGKRLAQANQTEEAYALGAGLFTNAKGEPRSVAPFKREPAVTGRGAARPFATGVTQMPTVPRGAGVPDLPRFSSPVSIPQAPRGGGGQSRGRKLPSTRRVTIGRGLRLRRGASTRRKTLARRGMRSTRRRR